MKANAVVRNSKQSTQWVKGSYFSYANYPPKINKLGKKIHWRETALPEAFH
jgi:hypothetical protein